MRRHSDIKTSKDITNAMNIAKKTSYLDDDHLLCRKDSRRLYHENDIDIADDIELESGRIILFGLPFNPYQIYLPNYIFINFFLELRCSLAHFVEGNDIARMSFKKKPRRKEEKKFDDDSDVVKIQFKGSNGDLTKEWNEKFNEGSKTVRFYLWSKSFIPLFVRTI